MSPLFSSPVVRRPHSLNIFSSETTGQIKVKFHMEPSWDAKTKVVQTVLVTSSVTKTAATTLYGKSLTNLLLRKQKADGLETYYTASGARVLPSLFK